MIDVREYEAIETLNDGRRVFEKSGLSMTKIHEDRNIHVTMTL